jgi:hypothetical protein
MKKVTANLYFSLKSANSTESMGRIEIVSEKGQGLRKVSNQVHCQNHAVGTISSGCRAALLTHNHRTLDTVNHL